jgi:hypothetical protein
MCREAVNPRCNGGEPRCTYGKSQDLTLTILRRLLVQISVTSHANAAEQKRNLGYGLSKASQEHSGWRMDQKGWRPYQGVMQLFGPWTATEAPRKAMQIKNPNPY